MHANIILARSIQYTTTLQTSSEAPEAQRAETFMAFWKPAMAEWRARWPNVNSFIDIHAENNTIMLNFMTLRFRGASSVEILAECRAAAIRTVDKVAIWNDCVADLRYASNFSVVNIAYGATLLLQLTLNLDHHVDAAVLGKIRNVASILQRVGQSRPNAVSVATLHAERILALIETIAAKADRADAALSQALISSVASSETGHALRHLRLHPPVWPDLPNLTPPVGDTSEDRHADPMTLASDYFPLVEPDSNDVALSQVLADIAAEGMPPTDFLGMAALDPMMAWAWEDYPALEIPGMDGVLPTL